MNITDYLLNFDSFGAGLRTIICLWLPILGIIWLLWTPTAGLLRKIRRSTQNPDRLGVRVSGFNTVAIAFIGLLLYAGISFILYGFIMKFVTLPDNFIGVTANVLYGLFTLILWAIGWDNDVIPSDQFGNIWVIGFRTPILLAAGPYWRLPNWMMRVKLFTAVYQVVQLGSKESPFVVNTIGATSKKKAGEEETKSIFEIALQTALRFAVKIEAVGEHSRFLGVSWTKDVTREEAFEKMDTELATIARDAIRVVSAKRSYKVVMEKHLGDESKDENGDVVKDGQDKPLLGHDEVIAILQLDAKRVLASTGTEVYSLTVMSAKPANQRDADALAGAVREEGQRSEEKQDAITFDALYALHLEQLIARGFKDDIATKDRAYDLALLSSKKKAPIQQIDITGDKDGRVNLNLAPLLPPPTT